MSIGIDGPSLGTKESNGLSVLLCGSWKRQKTCNRASSMIVGLTCLRLENPSYLQVGLGTQGS